MEVVDKERFYPNIYDGKEDSVDEAFKEKIRKHADALLERFQSRVLKEKMMSGENEDYSVYTGTTGVALLYWHLARNVNHRNSDIFNQRALNIVESCIPHLKGRRMSFLGGDAGPLALAIVIYHRADSKEKTAYCVEKLLSLQTLVFQTDESTPNEVLYGRAGYLFALLFVNQLTQPHGVIEAVVIKNVVNRLIHEGRRKGTDVLYYEWHEKCYLGAAHGICGILYILLKAKDHLDSEQHTYVQKTVDWLLNQRFSSGNLSSSLGSKDDRLVHWCHGAPGAIYLFLEAYRVYEDEKYLVAATYSAEVIWRRGLLKRSYSLCHGVAGNAYGLMAMYQFTKEEIYLKRSYLLAQWCFDYGSKNTRNPDRPLSLFEGLAGVVYMLQDFASCSDTIAPQFPAYELFA